MQPSEPKPLQSASEAYVVHGRIVNTGLQSPAHLAFSSDEKLLFVTCYSSNRVEVFSPAGNHLRGWEVPGKHDMPSRPSGVAINSRGNLYVSNEGPLHGTAKPWSALWEFTPEGKQVKCWEKPGGELPQKPFFRLRGVAVAADGNVYVAEVNRGRVLRLSPEGTYLGEWSCHIPGQGAQLPQDVAVASDGTTYILEGLAATHPTRWIHVYGPDGEDKGHLGKPHPGKFYMAEALSTDHEDNLYVSVSGHGSVTKLSPSGQSLAYLNLPTHGNHEQGSSRGVAVLRNGHIYVADQIANCLYIFRLKTPAESEE